MEFKHFVRTVGKFEGQPLLERISPDTAECRVNAKFAEELGLEVDYQVGGPYYEYYDVLFRVQFKEGEGVFKMGHLEKRHWDVLFSFNHFLIHNQLLPLGMSLPAESGV